jgi:MSHA pilin protein MshC
VSVIQHSHHFFPQNSFKQAKGFTLIELTLIMVIVGILAIMALPRFFDALSFTSKNYFDEALNSIRYAQKLAIVTGCEVQVKTDIDRVELLMRNNCRTGNFTRTIRDPATGGNFVKIAPLGVNITSLDMPIYFDRLGKAHRNSGQVIDTTLIVAARTICIVAETGFVYEQ